MRYVKKDSPIDRCIARGCGSYLVAVGTTVGDGESACCAKCGRWHTFTVFGASDDPNENSVGVSIERKSRARSGR